MKKIIVTLGIYAFFVLWISFIATSILMMTSQINGCNYNPYNSFLSEWLNITYFDEKERFESCMLAPDVMWFYKNNEEKELSCNMPIYLQVCEEPNFKPGILYFLIWMAIFFYGIRLRKRYILQ